MSILIFTVETGVIGINEAWADYEKIGLVAVVAIGTICGFVFLLIPANKKK